MKQVITTGNAPVQKTAGKAYLNRFRFVSSGLLFLFAVYCLIWNPELPFALPSWLIWAATAYFAWFPIKDMVAAANRTLFKGRQFEKNFTPVPELDAASFEAMRKSYNRRALGAMAFWLSFLLVVGILYATQVIGRSAIFFFFALSNFCVYFAVFFWCPFHKLFIRPPCCMECRIYNWDSFFAYSFLIFLPGPCTLLLVFLGVLSLLAWEWAHYRHPERFYKMSNQSLTCEACDMEACKQGKKKNFHTRLDETKE